MDSAYQETDLDRLFKAARQAHEGGDWYKALELYTAVSRRNPYYPGLDIQMRALEMRMIHGPASTPQERPPTPAGQQARVSTTSYSRSPQSTQNSLGCSPYLLYGTVALLLPTILTSILGIVLFPDWNWLFLWLIIGNVVTFLVYKYDKKVASAQGLRVPELILLMEAFLGAPLGTLCGCYLAPRHKTQKPSFLYSLWALSAVCVGWVTFYYVFLW